MSAKDWYLRQSSKDRLIVIIAGVVSIVGLLYLTVGQGLINGLESKQRTISKNNATIKQMLTYEAQAQSLKGGGGSSQKTTTKAPYLLVDSIIRKRGMKSPDRVEPIGKTGARVNFSAVEFDKLILALGDLEQYGMKVSTININRKGVGMVGARFRIDKN